MDVTTKKVLVVDDEPANRLLVAALLRRQGCHAVECASAQEALVQLAETSFDLVLMDLRMPGMDGLEATRLLRAGAAGQMPVVGLSADAQEEDRRAALEAGMDHYLVKPVTPATIREALSVVRPRT